METRYVTRVVTGGEGRQQAVYSVTHETSEDEKLHRLTGRIDVLGSPSTKRQGIWFHQDKPADLFFDNNLYTATCGTGWDVRVVEGRILFPHPESDPQIDCGSGDDRCTHPLGHEGPHSNP